MDHFKGYKPTTMNHPVDWSRMQDYRVIMVGSVASPPTLRGYLMATMSVGPGTLSFLVSLN